MYQPTFLNQLSRHARNFHSEAFFSQFCISGKLNERDPASSYKSTREHQIVRKRTKLEWRSERGALSHSTSHIRRVDLYVHTHTARAGCSSTTKIEQRRFIDSSHAHHALHTYAHQHKLPRALREIIVRILFVLRVLDTQGHKTEVFTF